LLRASFESIVHYTHDTSGQMPNIAGCQGFGALMDRRRTLKSMTTATSPMIGMGPMALAATWHIHNGRLKGCPRLSLDQPHVT
jgi:hypothetical protein